MKDDVVYRAKKGDREAFRVLVEEYTALAWRTARILLPNQEIVEDVLQEVWLDVWRGLPRFQHERPFRPWLLTIVANRCRMTIRRHEVSTVSFENVDVSDMASTDDVLNHIESLEIDSNLQKVLETLSFEQQHLLKLRFFADLELVEIAMVTNTPLGTVKSRLHRALVSLRLQLQMERPTA